MDASVIIPTRNRAAWLPTCLAHLEQQTVPAACFEVIVVDDGSMDDSFSVLQRYAQGAPIRIRPIRIDPAGFAAARNHGVDAASGALLLFLAEDELASPRLLENHLRGHAGPGDSQCLVGEVHVHPQLPPASLTRLDPAGSPDESGYEEQLPFLEAPASNLSISRALFAQVGGFDEAAGLAPFEHIVWAHRLQRAGVKLIRIDDARSYVWQPATLAAERERHYNLGYAMFEVTRMTRSGAAVDRYQLNLTPIERTLSAFFLPHVLRAYERNERNNPAFAGALRRRILHHDRVNGFNDAVHGRPRRVP